MKKVLVIVFLVFAVFIYGCHDETLDILEQSCKSDKPVPIKCEKFLVEDYSKTLTFTIAEIDKVELNQSTFLVDGVSFCEKKKVKTSSRYYVISMYCDGDWMYNNITGTFSFDYMFMGKPKHTDISFVRTFGKRDPVRDRKPIDDFAS